MVFHVKAKSERFTAASSRCRQNFKCENFTSSFGRQCQNIAPKSVPHVQHDYFSSFNQSNIDSWRWRWSCRRQILNSLFSNFMSSLQRGFKKHLLKSVLHVHLKRKKFFPGERVGKAVPIDNWEFRKFRSKFLHKRLALFLFIIPAPSVCPTPSSVLVFLPHWLKTDNTQHRVFEFLRERKRKRKRTRTTVFMLIIENEQRAYTELINAFYYIHTEIFASNFALWKSVSDFTSTNQRGETRFSHVKKSFRLSDWSK